MWKKLIKEILAATGWSQERLAIEAKTTQPTINRLMHGEIKDIEEIFRFYNARSMVDLAVVQQDSTKNRLFSFH